MKLRNTSQLKPLTPESSAPADQSATIRMLCIAQRECIDTLTKENLRLTDRVQRQSRALTKLNCSIRYAFSHLDKPLTPKPLGRPVRKSKGIR